MTKDRQNMQHRYIELFYDGSGSGAGGGGRGGGGGGGGYSSGNTLFDTSFRTYFSKVHTKYQSSDSSQGFLSR